MKRVAVIGGGPSGLATAKALLDVGLSPVVFEAASSLGGLWSRSNTSRRVWDNLRTNISKYTCTFADMPWPKEAPLHPTNQQVADYLQQYANRFLIDRMTLPPSLHELSSSQSVAADKNYAKPTFHFNTRIVKLSQNAENGKYLLQYQSLSDGETGCDSSNPISTEEFDKVVIASGFFNKHINHHLASSSSSSSVTVMYADEYKSPESFEGKNVMIVGASFSGCEIAAEIARVANKVYHIVPRYSFVLPRMIPLNPNHPATAFLPMDLVFYALNEDRQELVEQHFSLPAEHASDKNAILTSLSPAFEVLFKDIKDCEKTSSYLSKLVGTRNPLVDPMATLAESFTKNVQQGEEKPLVAISDEYKSMVRSGKIEVIAGRYIDHHIDINESKTTINIAASNKEENKSMVVHHSIDQTILCTGYTPDVSYLDSAVLSTLQYSDESNLMPMNLYKEQFHPSLPGLHFVGMYKGPYFGVIELQARLAAQYLAGLKSFPSSDCLNQGLQESLKIRYQSPKPQFPHADYVGMMLDLAKDLGLSVEQKKLQTSATPIQIIVPNTFTTTANDGTSVVKSKVLDEMYSEVQQRLRGKNLGQSIIYALEGGCWTFQRELFDKDHGSISTVDGKVKFSYITEPSYTDKHLWYFEEGTFTTARGAKFDVSQSYIYSYNQDLDSLDVYFSTVGKPTVIDRPFISLHFKPTERGWVAKADHLCGEDNYYADFEIAFNGLNVDRMKIVFDVLGPAKNYRSTTIFQLVK